MVKANLKINYRELFVVYGERYDAVKDYGHTADSLVRRARVLKENCIELTDAENVVEDVHLSAVRY